VIDGSLSGMQELASFAGSVTDEDFLICNLNGNVLLTSDASLANRVLTLPKEVTKGVLEGKSRFQRTTLGNIYEEKRFAVGVPIVSLGQTVGLVLAVTEAAALTAMWRGFVGMFFMTAVTVLLLSFVVSAWVSMRQSRPIREMAEATRRFADGNFDVRMHEYEDSSEINELAVSFNNMADSLQETERQRREFIANISHELKTPMTTIAGYTDGILDGTIPPEQEKQYLHIISDESRRLSRLVRRMLEVSQIQSREVMRKAPFDVCESMRRVLISLEKKITDRGLDVEADIPDGSVTVLGDNDLITQVIYNLLENATKFARPGSTLYLGLATSNGKALISVRNDGDTIPAEEIPLLFERFHKSDKSRSEDKDGVGLGLYIVRMILEQHKEHIAVSSEDGVTTFTFTLSLAGGQTQ
ncbi:MAG: HAMP domain-containing histidine kinase, partial [Oscillospiraceae bacterium]|nr:HAMP domain-containing histidine kinase [Oscillospiraceae bacterium]